MIAPECPRCHARASLAGQRPYCVKCGWNRDVAIASLRRGIKILPVVLMVFAGLFVFIWYGSHFRNPAPFAIVLTGLAAALLANYFLYRSQLAKLEALPPSASGATATTSQTAAGGGEASENKHGFIGSAVRDAHGVQPDPQQQALLFVPHPRQIRMAKRGRLGIAVGVIVAAIAIFLGIALFSATSPAGAFPTASERAWLIAGILAMILLAPYAIWRAQVRECDLLQNGEIAVGRVTKQWLNKNNSSIAYEFTDFRGDTHRGVGSDYTKKLYSGMPVTIFYDAHNPQRQIAYCSTFHEIVL